MHLNFLGNMEAFNIEQKILNKQPKHIAYIMDMIGGAVSSLNKALGAKDASVEKSQMDPLTAKDRASKEASAAALEKFSKENKRASLFASGSVVNPADMQYGRVSTANTGNALGRSQGGFDAQEFQSLESLNKLRGIQGEQAVAGQVAGLQNVGNVTEADWAQRTQSGIKAAQDALSKSMVGTNRQTGAGGARYETARDELTSENMKVFGESVANAIAASKFEAKTRADELQLKGLEASGRLAVAGGGLDVQAAGQEGQLQLAAFSKAGDLDMQIWKNLVDGNLQADANNIKQAMAEVDAKLKSGELTVQEAQMLNNSILQMEQQYATSQVAALTSLGQVASAGSMENIVTQDPGSAGLLPSLIGAGGSIGMGAMMKPKTA